MPTTKHHARPCEDGHGDIPKPGGARAPVNWEAVLSDVPERSIDLLNNIHLTQGKPSKALYVITIVAPSPLFLSTTPTQSSPRTPKLDWILCLNGTSLAT